MARIVEQKRKHTDTKTQRKQIKRYSLCLRVFVVNDLSTGRTPNWGAMHGSRRGPLQGGDRGADLIDLHRRRADANAPCRLPATLGRQLYDTALAALVGLEIGEVCRRLQ